MGIFSSILEKLISMVATVPAGAAPSASAGKPVPADAPASAAKSNSAKAPAAPVDVAAVLDAAVKAKGQKLDWRNSIVDMMKALDLDSSLSARKALAAEFHYTGDTNDSATMNIWLHKKLMKALAENGGKVPPELLK
jgi:hypothetical protein